MYIGEEGRTAYEEATEGKTNTVEKYTNQRFELYFGFIDIFDHVHYCDDDLTQFTNSVIKLMSKFPDLKWEFTISDCRKIVSHMYDGEFLNDPPLTILRKVYNQCIKEGWDVFLDNKGTLNMILETYDPDFKTSDTLVSVNDREPTQEEKDIVDGKTDRMGITEKQARQEFITCKQCNNTYSWLTMNDGLCSVCHMQQRIKKEEKDMETKKDRFKLEEQIQTVWGTKEDLDTLLNIVEEESDNMGATSCDRIMNTIIGIRELHNARSEQLFGTMEEMIHTGKM